MDLALSDEHLMLRDSIREFVDREIRPKVQEYDAEQKMLPPIKKMAEMDLLGICFPEKYEGAGMDYLALAIASEELERGDSSLRVLMSVHIGLNSCSIYQWGTEEQKMKFLVSQNKGAKIGAFAVTEPNCGSDIASLRMRAEKQGDSYIISGQKNWISLADTADNFLVIARTGEAGHKGLSAFIVEREFPGITTSSYHDKLGVRAGDTGEIFLDKVEVPEENLLGREGEGFKIAMTSLDNGRFTVAAGTCGTIKEAIETSVNYCHERKAFGQEIGKFQLIQEHLAYMQAAYDCSQLLVYKVAWLKNQGKRNTRETSMAKWYATEHALDAAHRAIQIHGAYGYSSSYPVERLWRNVRSASLYEGTTEIHKLIQGTYALDYRKDKPLRCELPPFHE
ncbi:MAG: acyl-CoA dehydrogenase family protein [Candidatus Odinarchaeota archaeon]